MPTASDRDELDKELRCEIEANIGGTEVAEMERFLKLHANELDITGVKRMEPHLKPSFNDSAVMLEFQLANMVEGAKINYRPVLKPQFEKDQEATNVAQFSCNLVGTGIKNPQLAVQMITAMVDLLIKTALKLQPGNSMLKLSITTGNKDLDNLANDILEKRLDANADKFREKGIIVAIKDKNSPKDRIIVSPIPELEDSLISPDMKNKQKPWSVPHGAPDLLPTKGKK